MRIAISINSSWNIYNFRMGLIQTLLNEGHEVIAIAPKDKYTQHLLDAGCSFEPLEVENTGSNPIKDLWLTYTYHKIYKKTAPDIILQFTIKPNIYGTLAAKKLSIPVINNVSGLGTVFLNNDLVSKVAKLLYRFAFRNVDMVFFQNADDKREFQKYIFLSENCIDLVPGSGIDLKKYFYQPKEVGSDDFTFLMVSRIIIDKGIYEYVKAAKILKLKLNNVSFQLLGEIDENHKRGILKSEVDTWVEEGIINYLGSTDNVEDYIKQSDCIVLPSYREGTPRTLLEGAAMSKPLITTDVPGCRQVVLDGINGYLCEAKNAKSLAQAMIRIYELNEQAIGEFGRSSRELVEEEFDEQIVIAKYRKWIFELANKQAVTV